MKTITEIEAKRIELQRTQRELCREADIDPSTYTKLRQDLSRRPHARTMRKLVDAIERFESGQAA